MVIALTEVPSEALKEVLRGLHRGTLEAPLTAEALARHGLQQYGEAILGHLRGVDARGAKAVVVAVIAERERRA
ncbi:MAG: hypothetical protein H6710_25020 [Myxococcales bacterium]|nr:hypothetical protein [Myxococcales bacterium]MCB9734704.1 hypothetical protein [Deltaproteobacteria bacterium]